MRSPGPRFVFIAKAQPTTQNKTKQLGWCGIIISKKNQTTTTTPQNTTKRITKKVKRMVAAPLRVTYSFSATGQALAFPWPYCWQ